jgi:heme A synthase
MTRLLQINRDNLKWAGRMALILVLVAVTDGLVGMLARKPLPWVAIIPGFGLLLTYFFVLLPIMRDEEPAGPKV